MSTAQEVLIVGGGVGGLTLALQLQRAGIPSRVLEAVPELKPLGVGINLLPHASKELVGLGLAEELDKIGVRTSCSVFFNRFGQLVYSDPAGAAAGYRWPQYSVHRGKLQELLAKTVVERLGADALIVDARAVAVAQHEGAVEVTTVDSAGGERTWKGAVAIGCDGVRSAMRQLLHGESEGLRYSGYTMWRGTVRMEPFLDGASMVRAGWLATGKMVVYPILDYPDGTQLINWVAELEVPQRSDRDWNRLAEDDSFAAPFAGWTFDWLDVPGMLRATENVFEYPMVDQEPLPFWTRGRVTLLGDAAHPMVPRGSNGAGQAIRDTRVLTDALAASPAAPADALLAYEKERLPATAEVVRLNRVNPPDAILREVFERTGDQPFTDISDVIAPSELRIMLDRYRSVTGSTIEALRDDA